MNTFKNVALGILSFLLFLSLIFFGLLFMANSTALNPDFLTSELDGMDVSLLIEESLEDEAFAEDTFEEGESEELKTAIIDNADRIEPLLKEQMNAVIYSVYDYLLVKKQELELKATLRNTVFSADFINDIVDEVDVSYFVTFFIIGRLAEEIPAEMEYLVDYSEEYLDDVIFLNRPWLKEQINVVTDPVVDYLLGESQSLYVVISIKPLLESLEENLIEPFLESPPVKLFGLSESTLQQHYDDYFEELTEVILPDITIDESVIGTDTRDEFTQGLAEAEEALEDARHYISYFRLAYILLIVFMVLLIAGIVLISRNVKYIALSVGITFMVYGIFEFVGILVARHFIGTYIPYSDLPPSLEQWIPAFLGNLFSPLQWFSLGILIGGIALVVVAFVYKRGQYTS